MESLKIFIADNGSDKNYHICNECIELKVSSEIECIDNSGNSINQEYLRELTVQYWAWKNCDSDIIGLLQYRRYLTFNNCKDTYYLEDFMDDDKISKFRLNKSGIIDGVNGYDIIEPKREKIDKKYKDIEEYYIKKEKKYGTKHFEEFCKLIKQKYSFLSEYLEKYLKSKAMCRYNLFVMKKKYFKEYSDILFDIVFSMNEIVDKRYASYEQLKEYSELASIILAIYCDYKRNINTIKQESIVEFLDVSKEVVLEPVFKENNIALVLASSDFYTIYLSSMITSIIENSSRQYNYDINILESSISKANKKLLTEISQEYPNISIRFYNVTRKMKGIKLKAGGHIGIETYYRLLIPEIFKKYDKVLFLDSDMTVHHDVADLFMLDITNYIVAAAHDQCIAAFCNGSDKTFIPYCKKILKIDNYHDYFQAGVMLLNLEKFREKYTQEEIFEIATSHQFRYVDQDIMNLLCRGEVKHIDLSWNCFPDFGNYDKEFMPNYLRLEYEEARKNPKICHHTGPIKPWESLFADSMMTYMFWKNAKKSPFYEMILFRTMHTVSNQMYFERKYNKRYRKFFRFIKDKIIINIVGIFCPVGTKRRRKIKLLYCKLRGIEIPTWEMADE